MEAGKLAIDFLAENLAPDNPCLRKIRDTNGRKRCTRLKGALPLFVLISAPVSFGRETLFLILLFEAA